MKELKFPSVSTCPRKICFPAFRRYFEVIGTYSVIVGKISDYNHLSGQRNIFMIGLVLSTTAGACTKYNVLQTTLDYLTGDAAVPEAFIQLYFHCLKK